MTSPTSTATDWTAPGPGPWERDAAHQERPFSTLWLDVALVGFANGFGGAFERLGMPFKAFQVADVNGWFYGTFVPIEEEQFPVRMATAEAALASRPWRAIADEWYAGLRAEIIQRNQRLQAEDPVRLDDRALARHLAAALDLLRDGASRHFLHAAAHWVGVGLLANEAAAIPGWSPERVIQALAGASPASVATIGGLRNVAAAITANATASALLAADGDPQSTLDQLRAASPAIAEALDCYLDDHGWQIFTGFDFTHQAMIELPALLLSTIRGAAAPAGTRVDETASLLAAVPAVDRARFEVLLDDAQVAYGIRDDDSGPTVQRPIGLVRRAVLEAGRRLAARGLVHDADDAFDATGNELHAMLTGDGPLPRADELAHRAMRRRPPFEIPPRRLGDDEPPPDGEMPEAMGQVMAALFTAMALEDTVDAEEPVAGPLRGAGASRGVYEGRARVIRGTEDFARLEQGDVLVAAMTTPAYNVVLPLLGAVVTDRGGILSHPAIVAREFGIPAVVGTGNATATIRDGARVRVDGTAGTVTLLG